MAMIDTGTGTIELWDNAEKGRGDGVFADLPRGEPRGFAREGFWLGKVLIFHTEVFRVVLTDKPKLICRIC